MRKIGLCFYHSPVFLYLFTVILDFWGKHLFWFRCRKMTVKWIMVWIEWMTVGCSWLMWMGDLSHRSAFEIVGRTFWGRKWDEEWESLAKKQMNEWDRDCKRKDYYCKTFKGIGRPNISFLKLKFAHVWFKTCIFFFFIRTYQDYFYSLAGFILYNGSEWWPRIECHVVWDLHEVDMTQFLF